MSDLVQDVSVRVLPTADKSPTHRIESLITAITQKERLLIIFNF